MRTPKAIGAKGSAGLASSSVRRSHSPSPAQSPARGSKRSPLLHPEQRRATAASLGDLSAASRGEEGAARRRDVVLSALGIASATGLPWSPLFAPPADAAYGSSGSSSSSSASSSPGGDLEFTTFYGAAAPPATYGSLGGTSPDKAKYSYEVPSTWVEEATSKVEKGTGGQDSRWVMPGSRGKVKAFCLTLNRAGQDGAAYKVTDSAINAVAAADSNLQDAILTGNITSALSTQDDQDYITYDIDAVQHYRVKLTIDNTGRLFAFVVTAPDRTFQQQKKTFGRMADSFTTYNSISQFV